MLPLCALSHLIQHIRSSLNATFHPKQFLDQICPKRVFQSNLEKIEHYQIYLIQSSVDAKFYLQQTV